MVSSDFEARYALGPYTPVDPTYLGLVRAFCFSCEACVDAVFTRPTAPCPECGVALRRNLYRAQQFEDPAVEREVDIRKKVLQE